jgi:hypothetical protein
MSDRKPAPDAGYWIVGAILALLSFLIGIGLGIGL